MIKVCYLLGGFTENGGIGRVTSILMNNLCKSKDYKMFALSFFNTNKPAIYKIEPEITRDCLFDERVDMKEAILKGGINRLKQYLSRNNIDILVACGALYYPISILACRGTGTRCVCWEHSNVLNTKDHAYQSICRRFGAKNADIIVALTKYDKRSFIDTYGIDKVVQIYNPIDEEAFDHARDYDPASRKILSVGRLSYQKNFELLIEIAAEVLPENPDWIWDIYGQGELRELLQNKIRDYGLDRRLTLKGQVSDLYSLYNEYAMLVMTSRYEGFPMTLLEGTAFGLPLVSFDILTGPGEIIRNGENGYLVEPFSKDSMIACINRLISNEELRINMSKASKDTCGRFSLHTIASEWKELFRKLL